jgi:nicotinate-nucleotide adenylyltransferase
VRKVFHFRNGIKWRREVLKIGVLGGTFDPVHIGHMVIAEAARQEIGLSRVIFVTAGEPWLKGHRTIAAGEHRLAMAELAIAENPSFSTASIDLDRPGPSYTVDTLNDLKSELGADAELYFIMGMDALAGFPEWKEPERIISICRLVAARRPGCLDIDLKQLERDLPGISKRISILNNPLSDISSSAIRERVASGLSITGLVPAAVERYIMEKGLYNK